MNQQARDLMTASYQAAVSEARKASWPVVGQATDDDTGEVYWQAYSGESAAELDGCDVIRFVE